MSVQQSTAIAAGLCQVQIQFALRPFSTPSHDSRNSSAVLASVQWRRDLKLTDHTSHTEVAPNYVQNIGCIRGRDSPYSSVDRTIPTRTLH